LHGIGSDSEESMPGAPESTLYSFLGRLSAALAGSFNARAVWQLRRQIEYQSHLIRRAEAVLANTEIFERASVAAHMGVWQCELPSERLVWSNGTYDLFGLERRSGIVRSDILRSYSDESLARLEKVRAEALEAGTGFGLDAEIHDPAGGTRWIRISATVERENGEPVRLFGVKQDITEEKQLFERMRYLAGHDVMTGLANRTRFQARFAELCEPGGPGGVLMLIDLDDFKEVNDTFGHALGDACLVEFAHRLSALCQSAELVARIGGDEFAVLFGPAVSPQKAERIAQRIITAAEAPMNCSGRVFRIGASIGYAFMDGGAPAAVFAKADEALYAAKAAGRRAISSCDTTRRRMSAGGR